MKFVSFLCVISTAFLLSSCESELERSLRVAGENRSELEKVLAHFESDPDPLKYEAAKFLIENMPSQNQPLGPAVEKSDSVYLATSSESQNVRTQYFNDAISSVDMSQFTMVSDISMMKAEYLIRLIDEACEVWNHASWCKEYDKSYFFEYVLPYRLVQEPISNWRETISQQYPLLNTDVVISRRGLQYEAEEAQCSNCETKDLIGATNGKAEMMFPGISSVSYTIEAQRATQKRLSVKYSSVARNVSVLVSVNNQFMDTIHLARTRNIGSFVEKWLNIPLPISEGKNVITFSSASDTLCLDYVQLGAVEQFKHEDLEKCALQDSYYTLENVQINRALSFDTAYASKNHALRLIPYSETDSTLLVRLDYAGYPSWRIGYYRRDSQDLCLQMEFGVPNTLLPKAPVSVGEYIMRPFDQWVFFPLGDDLFRIMNKHTGMFLDVERNMETGMDILVQNPYSESRTQQWILRRRSPKLFSDSYFQVGSAMSEAMRVFDLTHQFEYYIYGGQFSTKGSSLFKAKSGKCADETSFSIFLCRYLGIPSAYDFTPHWGNRSGSHSWSVLVNPDGKSTPFYMGNFPGDTAHYFHSYIKPKVFRYRYSLNKEMVKDFATETSVPSLFLNPHYTDVTDEYCKTTDVVRHVSANYNGRVVYICVFDNRNWVPVYYGKADDEEVTFQSMGRGVVYMTAALENGKMVPLGSPFLLTVEGEIRELTANNKKVKMTLLRKYPFMGAQDFFNSRMNGGQFQASNHKNFSDSIVLHTHKGITNGNWYNIPVSTEQKFKYLRYIGGKGSHCNINELEFYDSDGKKIGGKIIGTEGEGWAPKEKVFDGNILTGFGGITPDGNWVGLQLNRPVLVSRIRYIGRNDGNCVEVGDKYELYYWSEKGKWELLGTQTAKSNELLFDNIPSEGLYILKDVTKGVEERIFTYEKGKQVWW